jgi:hypothetical protein
MLKRQKSRRSRAADILTTYLKLETARKAAKGAAKAAKWTAYGKAAKTVAQRTPKKGLLALAGGLGAAALAARKLRGTPAEPTAA